MVCIGGVGEWSVYWRGGWVVVCIGEVCVGGLYRRDGRVVKTNTNIKVLYVYFKFLNL